MKNYRLLKSGSIKCAVILIVFAVTCNIVMAQAPAAPYMFQKTWGGTGQDYPYDAHIRADGGYIFGGVTNSFPGPYVSCWVMRTNYKGDTLWTTSYGGTGGTCDQQYVNDICESADGGSIAVGGKTVCGNTNVGGEITRLDSNGNVLWTKYCSAFADPYPVIQTGDGNFVVGGYLTGLGMGGEEGFLHSVYHTCNRIIRAGGNLGDFANVREYICIIK